MKIITSQTTLHTGHALRSLSAFLASKLLGTLSFLSLKCFRSVPFETASNIDDIIKEDEKLKEAEVILKRNYDLMQLDEVVISSSAKIKILDKVNEPINKLNKIQFQKRFIEDRLFATLPNMDSWLVQCFGKLNEMAGKTNG